jgi:hypothetical protein
MYIQSEDETGSADCRLVALNAVETAVAVAPSGLAPAWLTDSTPCVAVETLVLAQDCESSRAPGGTSTPYDLLREVRDRYALPCAEARLRP